MYSIEFSTGDFLFNCMHYDYYRNFKISKIEFLQVKLGFMFLKKPFYLKINNDFYYYSETLENKCCSDFPIYITPVGNAADTCFKTTISIVDGNKEEIKIPYRIHFDKRCSNCNDEMKVTNFGLEWKPKFLSKVNI